MNKPSTRKPRIPCGPGAPQPMPVAIPIETPAQVRLRERFGLRDRLVAILKDLDDAYDDARFLVSDAPSIRDLFDARAAVARVRNRLDR